MLRGKPSGRSVAGLLETKCFPQAEWFMKKPLLFAKAEFKGGKRK